QKFSLTPYLSAVEKELAAYGFQTTIGVVDKKTKTEIESAFIKANTRIHLLKIEALKKYGPTNHKDSKLQIKFEVDTDPAISFQSETQYLLSPISFPIISLKKPDLFAGKLHALLYRSWKNRVKGRDFYDYVWYLKNSVPVRLEYLRDKAIQSGHAKPTDLKDLKQLKEALSRRFKTVDFENAKRDVAPFVKNQSELDAWSLDFFLKITEMLSVV
ncbi:MAG: nucleotidyl transferase AbiEii/AbiGii toxin family protein, partial [Bdellovibrionaceae bacterium]|nr:nucleotidyl transferase AbiEii/AbiGii toxin family protein [Pseudobdellovibrionaceae bacterium]